MSDLYRERERDEGEKTERVERNERNRCFYLLNRMSQIFSPQRRFQVKEFLFEQNVIFYVLDYIE